MNENRIRLTEYSQIFTKKRNQAFLILEGEIRVFVCVLRNGRIVCRFPCGTFSTGETIPQLFCEATMEKGKLVFLFLIRVDPGKEAVLEETSLQQKSAEQMLLRVRQYRDELPETQKTISVQSRSESHVNLGPEAQEAQISQPDPTQAFEEAMLLEMKRIYNGLNHLVEENRERRRGDREKSLREMQDAFHTKIRDDTVPKMESEYPIYNAAAYLCNICKLRPVPLNRLLQTCTEDFTVADIARMSGFICREVELPKHWKKLDLGPLLIIRDGGKDPIICFRKYGRNLYHEESMKGTAPLRKLPEPGEDEHWTVYSVVRTFPAKALNWKDICKFMFQHLRVADFATLLIAAGLAAVASLQNSTLNNALFGVIIPHGQQGTLWPLVYYILAWSIGGLIFGIVKSLGTFRMNSRVKYALQAAFYDRLFHLKESYFRKQESARVSYRIENLPNTYIMLFSAAVDVVLMLVLTGLYIGKMTLYSASLTSIAVFFALVTVALTIVIGYRTQKLQRQRCQQTAAMRSELYQAFSIIQTIRTTGTAENVQNRYLEKYARYGALDMRSAKAARITNALISIVTCLGLVVYFQQMAMGSAGITTAAFLAFLSAASAFTGAMNTMAQDVLKFLIVWPMLKEGADILNEIPDESLSGMIPEKLNGQIRVSHVSFRYDSRSPEVLHDVDLEIRPGEYVAIVGGSGCGKSTLLRLMLGFETPNAGKIYYDDVELERLNKIELRRRIGTVLQDGVLFSGSIFKNISIVCPDATQEDVEWAAEMADLKRDVDQMPLGFSTPVSEEAGTISGGQKQRVMIARAILPRPTILFLDEATSALDNQSQDTVCRNLAEMNCTRIVIAHRLSTVEKCDRIYVMDEGTIAEVGTYRELIERKGLFYQLVQRQML